MDLAEYASYDGVAIAAAIKSGELGAHEVLDTALAAVEKVNGEINGVLAVMPERAKSSIEAGLPEGPLTGVPFLIKECMLMMKGAPCRNGSRMMEGFVAPSDTELMKRFRQAGLVTFGTTSTPETAYSPTTEPVMFGPTRNPWDIQRSAGGSSGGAAAAVAAGIVPIAHGNDGGGSIRIPAACCGLVGLKPTRHRVPQGPDYGEMLQGFSCELVVTRTVRDTAVVLDAVHGADVGARNVIAPPEHPYVDVIHKPQRRMRIAVMDSSFSGTAVDPDCVDGVGAVARTCLDLGHDIVLARPEIDWDMFFEATHVVWATTVAATVASMEQLTGRRATPELLEAATWACYQDGKQTSATGLIDAMNDLNTISRQVGAFFEGYDLLLTPTMARLPLMLGELDQNRTGIEAREWTRAVFDWCNFTPLFNATGQPAISLPLHFTDKNLPVGMQFVGKMNDESRLLAIASQLEQAMPWKHRLPAVHVGT